MYYMDIKEVRRGKIWGAFLVHELCAPHMDFMVIFGRRALSLAIIVRPPLMSKKDVFWRAGGGVLLNVKNPVRFIFFENFEGGSY